MRSQLLDAEFAFLPACHAAELTDESIADKALHLAAAMQFCGFRSVVGMWAMADMDGRTWLGILTVLCSQIAHKVHVIMRERQAPFEMLW